MKSIRRICDENSNNFTFLLFNKTSSGNVKADEYVRYDNDNVFMMSIQTWKCYFTTKMMKYAVNVDFMMNFKSF